MRLRSNNFSHGAPIPPANAFGRIPDARSEHFAPGGNRSPHLAWEDVPAGTRSFALLCIDDDVPSVGDDVNQEGRSVPAALARVAFVHWSMIDVPASVRELAEGACGEGLVAHGKQAPPGPEGARQGRNDYTGWFAGDPDMQGDYRGYDGPCPPWNDERVHRYDFRLYALDVERLDVPDSFSAEDVERAMEGHVLARAHVSGTYTMNPALTRD